MSQVKIQGNASGTGIFTVAAPNSNTDRTLTLPDGAGTLVRDDGSGKLLKAQMPTGSVLQVVTTFKNDVFSASLAGGSFTDVTGFSVTITPISTTSKILVLASYTLATGGAAMTSRLLRNGTLISNGIATGARVSASSAAISHTGDANRGVPTSINFLDSPSTTSAVTYKLQIGAVEPSGTHTCFFNTSGVDNDAAYNARPASSITLLEIAG